MGWIECVRCEKYRRDFVARTFALVGPFCTEFRKRTKQSWMHPNSTNAPKCQFRVQWGGSGTFVAKSSTRLRGTNFCTSSAHFAPSFIRQPNSPECTQIVRNAPKRQFYCLMGWIGFVAKNSNTTSWHELLHYFGPLCTEFRKAIKRSRMHPNSMKRTKTSF